MWPDGNSAAAAGGGHWAAPFAMVCGWVLLVATFVAVVAFIASFVTGAGASGIDGDD